MCIACEVQHSCAILEETVRKLSLMMMPMDLQETQKNELQNCVSLACGLDFDTWLFEETSHLEVSVSDLESDGDHFDECD